MQKRKEQRTRSVVLKLMKMNTRKSTINQTRESLQTMGMSEST
jgi:hypothetical protein